MYSWICKIVWAHSDIVCGSYGRRPTAILRSRTAKYVYTWSQRRTWILKRHRRLEGNLRGHGFFGCIRLAATVVGQCFRIALLHESRKFRIVSFHKRTIKREELLLILGVAVAAAVVAGAAIASTTTSQVGQRIGKGSMPLLMHFELCWHARAEDFKVFHGHNTIPKCIRTRKDSFGQGFVIVVDG